jgi:hypothetical protein
MGGWGGRAEVEVVAAVKGTEAANPNVGDDRAEKVRAQVCVSIMEVNPLVL